MTASVGETKLEDEDHSEDLGLPTELELTLLSLDHLRDLRRSPALLGAVNADYLTIACWALQRAFTQPPLSQGNDAYYDNEVITGDASVPPPSPLPSVKVMEQELLNDDGYEYDDCHTSNSHRFYSLGGLASGPSLRGPLTLGELVSAGLSGLGARSRNNAEQELIRSELFQQFVSAVQEKGFFQGGIYEEKYHKVVAKFRTKLASKADAEVGDLMALSAAEQHRKRRARRQEGGALAASQNKQDPPTPSAEYTSTTRMPLTPKILSPEEDLSVHSSSAENPADAQQAEHLKTQGNTHMQRKEFEQAAECYTQALKLSPAGQNSHVYFSNRAAALVSMKQFQQAIVDSERSLALKPDYGKAHARLGLAHFLLGNYRQSMEAYTVSLKYEPDNKSSKNYLEKAARRLAEYGGDSKELSYSVVSEWKSNEETQAEKYKTRGNQFMVSRDYPSSLQAYTKAIELSPNGPQSHVYYSNRAAALCYLERYQDAEEDSLKSLQLVPTYGKAHARLGLSRFFLGDYAGAVEAYQEALVHDPENAASKSYLQKAQAKLNVE